MSTVILNSSALGVDWHKSSYSGANSNCIETARLGGGTAVRDSKRPDGPALAFPSDQWDAFIDSVKSDSIL
ncbi:DUF397 domain-containing protein [Streptomyces flavidovirens]|uniref:DUF397 domain-containing protein n=1 Tax=Streptomyces flavidovirens TaxID=67298 RepID=UPI0034288700